MRTESSQVPWTLAMESTTASKALFSIQLPHILRDGIMPAGMKGVTLAKTQYGQANAFESPIFFK
jgi:hypothetical protein